MHDRDDDMVIDWSDGPHDRSNDLLRFIFTDRRVDEPLGEAWSAAHQAERNHPNELWTSPSVMAEEVLAHEAADYQQRVLAHLRASLRIGVAKADLAGGPHPTPMGERNEDAPNDLRPPHEPLTPSTP